MKDHVSLQERLKDLRVEKGLKLEELAEKTGISKSALASYENEENRNKEINHGNLITLADFYEVSIDYLFCRTENREQINTPLSELHLTDEAVALLKSGRINTRLLCEMMSHEKFAELMADAEIYVDGMATMRFHDLNSALAAVRVMILEEHPEAAADRSLKILEAGQIEEEDFFCHVTHKTWDTILHDIRKAHENDMESAPDTTPADELILKMVMWNCLMLISLRFIVVVCTVMKCKHRISFVCMVGNISIFIDDYFRMVLHLFSENHFYTIFQYLLQTRHSLKFTCNRNHLLQFFQSNKIHFNHLPAFRQQVSLL